MINLILFQESDILTRMKKLLTERKEYCTVDTDIDTAYEAIDSLDVLQQTSFSTNVEFEGKNHIHVNTIEDI